MDRAILEALARQVSQAVKDYTAGRLGPLETTLAQMEVRLAALEQRLEERGTSDDATQPLRAIK